MYNITSQHNKFFLDRQKELLKNLQQERRKFEVTPNNTMTEHRRQDQPNCNNPNRSAISFEKPAVGLQNKIPITNPMHCSHDASSFKNAYDNPIRKYNQINFDNKMLAPQHEYYVPKHHCDLDMLRPNYLQLSPTFTASNHEKRINMSSKPAVSLKIPKYKIRQHSNQNELAPNPTNDLFLKMIYDEQNYILKTYKESTNLLMKERDEYINGAMLLKASIDRSRNAQLSLINKLNHSSYADKNIEEPILPKHYGEGNNNIETVCKIKSQPIAQQRNLRNVSTSNIEMIGHHPNACKSEDKLDNSSMIKSRMDAAASNPILIKDNINEGLLSSIKYANRDNLSSISVKRLIKPMKIKMDRKCKIMLTNQSVRLAKRNNNNNISNITVERSKLGQNMHISDFQSNSRQFSPNEPIIEDVTHLHLEDLKLAMKEDFGENQTSNFQPKVLVINNNPIEVACAYQSDKMRVIQDDMKSQEIEGKIRGSASQSPIQNPKLIYFKKAKPPIFKLKKADFTNVRHASTAKNGCSSINNLIESQEYHLIKKEFINPNDIVFMETNVVHNEPKKPEEIKLKVAREVESDCIIHQPCNNFNLIKVDVEPEVNNTVKLNKIAYNELVNISEMKVTDEPLPSTGVVNPKLELFNMFHSIKQSVDEIKKTDENLKILKSKRNQSRNKFLLAPRNNTDQIKIIQESSNINEEGEEEPQIVLKSKKRKISIQSPSEYQKGSLRSVESIIVQKDKSGFNFSNNHVSLNTLMNI